MKSLNEDMWGGIASLLLSLLFILFFAATLRQEFLLTPNEEINIFRLAFNPIVSSICLLFSGLFFTKGLNRK
jgi:hypothetical protein